MELELELDELVVVVELELELDELVVVVELEPELVVVVELEPELVLVVVVGFSSLCLYSTCFLTTASKSVEVVLTLKSKILPLKSGAMEATLLSS